MQISSPKIPENCQSLEDELDFVKFEIVKMMSEKENKSEDAHRQINYEKKISELMHVTVDATVYSRGPLE